ncbi:MAG: hypothetical protein LJE85_04415 [Gammaproteobacteria bacterium]|nr:hypothetical protein [Gammaproteobacteria bacterium]
MSDKVVKINVAGPESVVISQEERYEVIAQVSKALQERRQERLDECNMEWEAEDLVFDFSLATMDFN